MNRPNPNEAFPNPNLPRLCFIKNVVKNQGVYNGLIAVLLLIAVWQQDLLWNRLLLVYVVLVALYGSLTSKPSIILKRRYGKPALHTSTVATSTSTSTA